MPEIIKQENESDLNPEEASDYINNKVIPILVSQGYSLSDIRVVSEAFKNITEKAGVDGKAFEDYNLQDTVQEITDFFNSNGLPTTNFSWGKYDREQYKIDNNINADQNPSEVARTLVHNPGDIGKHYQREYGVAFGHGVDGELAQEMSLQILEKNNTEVLLMHSTAATIFPFAFNKLASTDPERLESILSKQKALVFVRANCDSSLFYQLDNKVVDLIKKYNIQILNFYNQKDTVLAQSMIWTNLNAAYQGIKNRGYAINPGGIPPESLGLRTAGSFSFAVPPDLLDQTTQINLAGGHNAILGDIYALKIIVSEVGNAVARHEETNVIKS